MTRRVRVEPAYYTRNNNEHLIILIILIVLPGCKIWAHPHVPCFGDPLYVAYFSMYFVPVPNSEGKEDKQEKGRAIIRRCRSYRVCNVYIRPLVHLQEGGKPSYY